MVTTYAKYSITKWLENNRELSSYEIQYLDKCTSKKDYFFMKDFPALISFLVSLCV